jgi:hypothetical protein
MLFSYVDLIREAPSFNLGAINKNQQLVVDFLVYREPPARGVPFRRIFVCQANSGFRPRHMPKPPRRPYAAPLLNASQLQNAARFAANGKYVDGKQLQDRPRAATSVVVRSGHSLGHSGGTRSWDWDF